jgi:hypothetical protein
LSGALKTLEKLDKTDCTREQAREAWDDVFDSDYFSKQPDKDDDGGGGGGNSGNSGGNKGSAMAVTSVETARRNDGGGRFG